MVKKYLIKTREYLPHKICEHCNVDKLLSEFKKSPKYKNKTVIGTYKVCILCTKMVKRSLLLKKHTHCKSKKVLQKLPDHNANFKMFNNKEVSRLLERFFRRKPTSMEILFFGETGYLKRDSFNKLTEDKIFRIKQTL